MFLNTDELESYLALIELVEEKWQKYPGNQFFILATIGTASYHVKRADQRV